MSRAILPGQTIGVLGGGQLGRMLAMVARRNGYRVHVLTSEANSPAAPFANQTFVADYHDEATFRQFAQSIDVLTFEFESVPSQPLCWVPERVPIRPGPHVFHATQDRTREKQFLSQHGIPLPRFAEVQTADQLPPAITSVGCPAVLKSSAGGYDGKGQFVLRSPEQADTAWQAIGARPATLEQFVELSGEFSVIVARGVDGHLAVYEPIYNEHANHILDVSTSPSGIPASATKQALEIAHAVATAFELVGLICIEFFLTHSGEVLVNEIAPRPHNSGHLTIEAHATSQFEQQLRAICGLPLGSTRQIRHAAMANLLGDLWQKGIPRWETVSHVPEAYLHLYDKEQPKPGRKMGHLTVCAESSTAAARLARVIRQQMGRE